jgi:hypothetical protein
LRLNHENRTIIRAVAQIISTVQKSGIAKNMAYNRAFNKMKYIKNLFVLISHFFLVSQLAKKIT